MPLRGLPVGFQKFLPVTAGNKFPEFAAMWTKMTTDDMYGAEVLGNSVVVNLHEMRGFVAASDASAREILLRSHQMTNQVLQPHRVLTRLTPKGGQSFRSRTARN
eukprot:1563086-Amphidinium_carterae.1